MDEAPAFPTNPTANGEGPPPPFATPFEPPVDAPPEPIRPPDAGPAPEPPQSSQPPPLGPFTLPPDPTPAPAPVADIAALMNSVEAVDARLGVVQIQTTIAIGLGVLVLAAVFLALKAATGTAKVTVAGD